MYIFSLSHKYVINHRLPTATYTLKPYSHVFCNPHLNVNITRRIYRVHRRNSLHGDSLSVFDMFDVHVTVSLHPPTPHLCTPFPSLTCPSFLFPSPYLTLYLSLTDHVSYLILRVVVPYSMIKKRS